jgi:hypothetical protein
MCKTKHMSHTSIGIFREQTQAETAVHHLMDGGFAREKMDISFPDPKESRGDVTDENGVLDSKVGRFFLEVFSGDANQALRYGAVAQRGVIIAVQSDFYADALKAAQIMDECGAINVDEEARLVEDSMTRSDRTLLDRKQVEEQKKQMEASIDSTPGHENTRTVQPDERGHIAPYTLHTRIVDRPIGGDYRLREEEIWVERSEGTLPETDASDATSGKETHTP